MNAATGSSRAQTETRQLSPDQWCDANAEFAAESGFRDFDRGPSAGDGPPTAYPVLLELDESATVATLRARGVRVPNAYPDHTRYATAWLDELQYIDLRATGWGGIVKRWALQLPVIPLRPPYPARRLQGLPPSANPKPSSRGPEETRPSTVIGIIDSGCPFADPRYFRDPDNARRSRIRALWDQTNDAFAGIPQARRPPADFDRGAELRAQDIDDWLAACAAATGGGIAEEDACYRRAGYPMMPEGFVHGAAVLDLAAGPLPLEARYPVEHGSTQQPPSWDSAMADKASDADIIFVQLPRKAVDDSSSGSLPMQLLDGLRYIVERAADARRVIVSISDVTSRSLHDGHSILEDAIRALRSEVACRALPMKLRIVVAAGNSHMEARHAVIKALEVPSEPGVNGADVAVVHLLVDNEQASFLNIAIPPVACGDVRLRITPPAILRCAAFEAAPGQVVTWMYDGEACFWIVIPPLRDEPQLALAAWSPTATCPDGRRSARAGNWCVQVLGGEGVEVPLWISQGERNQDNPSSIRQARFFDADASYDPWRWMRTLLIDPAPPESVIRRNHTLTTPATMARQGGVVAVGGRMLRMPVLPPSKYFLKDEGPRSAYSSIGASPAIPSVLRPADFAPTQAGIRGAGSPSGCTLAVTGTSFAMPQVVRALANK